MKVMLNDLAKIFDLCPEGEYYVILSGISVKDKKKKVNLFEKLGIKFPSLSFSDMSKTDYEWFTDPPLFNFEINLSEEFFKDLINNYSNSSNNEDNITHIVEIMVNELSLKKLNELEDYLKHIQMDSNDPIGSLLNLEKKRLYKALFQIAVSILKERKISF